VTQKKEKILRFFQKNKKGTQTIDSKEILFQKSFFLFAKKSVKEKNILENSRIFQ